MTPLELAQRLFSMDWSGCSLQHQLAVACAVETLRGAPPGAVAYRAQQSRFSTDWHIEREFSCINGLSCWFLITTVHEPDESETGYTDGAIGSAEQRATQIADALNATCNLEAPLATADPVGFGDLEGTVLLFPPPAAAHEPVID